jgi:(2Fe-2S) ferredoxin
VEKVYRANILICTGTSCVAFGSLELRDVLVEEIERMGLQDKVKVETTGCNGFCAAGPLMILYPEGIFYKQLGVEDVSYFVEEHLVKGRNVQKHLYEERERKELVPVMSEIGFFKNQVLVALRNRGLIDPEEIDEYIGRDGYTAMAKALTEMTPKEIVEEIIQSGLRGRGDAWNSTKETATVFFTFCKYLVLEDYLTLGFEVTNKSPYGEYKPYVHLERWDNRMVYFFTKIRKDEIYEVAYILRAELPGDFIVKPSRMECMYEPSIQGWSAPARFTVEKK